MKLIYIFFGILLSIYAFLINICDENSDLYVYANVDQFPDVNFEPGFDFLLFITPTELPYWFFLVSISCMFIMMSIQLRQKYTDSQVALFSIGLAPVLFSSLLRQELASLFIAISLYRKSLIYLLPSPLFHYGSIIPSAILIALHSIKKSVLYLIVALATLFAIYCIFDFELLIDQVGSFAYSYSKFKSYYEFNESADINFKPYLLLNIIIFVCMGIFSNGGIRLFIFCAILVLFTVYNVEVLSERFLFYFQLVICFVDLHDSHNPNRFNKYIYMFLLLRIYQNILYLGFA